MTGQHEPRAHLVAAGCILAHILLSLLYSLNTPLWESYDENGHYAYARYLAMNRALPPAGQPLVSSFDESHQPPLYYALVAFGVALAGPTEDIQPRFAVGARWGVVPDRELDAFPYRGTALAVRLGRLVSILISALGVAATYRAARILFAGRTRTALLATAIYALWPMLLFLSGVISNDVGISVFGALTLWIAARLWFAPPGHPRRADYVALAACLAGAAMTKDSAVSLMLFGGLVVAAVVVRAARRRERGPLAALAWLIAPLAVLLAAGAALSDGRTLRQYETAGRFTAASLAGSPGGSPDGGAAAGEPEADFMQTLGRLAREALPMTARSALGAFGWGAVAMPEAWYAVSLGFGVVALAGLGWAVRRRAARPAIALCAVFTGCVSLAPAARAALSGDYALVLGRFLMPALPGLASLTALGLLSLPIRAGRPAAALSLGWLASIALLTPWAVLEPTYRLPALLDPASAPSGLQARQDITFGDSIQLLGYSYPAPKTVRGEPAAITLYWRALRPMADDYVLRLELFDVAGRSLRVSRDHSPGRGTFPTSAWRTGDTFAETYSLPLPADADAPTRVTHKATWWSPRTGQALAPACADGGPCDPKVGSLPMRLDGAAEAAWRGAPAQYRLGGVADLVGWAFPATVAPGEILTLSVMWRARSDEAPPYTVFAHLISDAGELIAQSDGTPRGGLYPVESWSAGEIVPDLYVLPVRADAPAGSYRIKVGMYDSSTRERLPARDAGGILLPDGLIPLREVRVAAGP